MQKRGSWLIFLVYLVIGLYFVNYSIEYVDIPSSMDSFNPIIFIIGGVLILLGGINHLRISNRHHRVE
ncbi:MAG: hypothetical protein AABX93_00455 [Nanoarchaeota archaeon]